ncbi:hypothetical protein GIB67_013871 [Kingdonia uniflora]|uniref:Uncharacterized protein n=1 Tax=Kingdonia uniflora TaxID=39325 RepID=A0A7J7LDB8_9MAGN|nr:hypothetical protein GIB67_013871 [Kingdonia uniflora]
MATSGSAYADVMEIPACDAAVEQEVLDLAKRDPIRLDTQIRSSISQLSVAWKSAAEVLKVAAADRAEYEAEKASLAEQLKERTALCEQLQKEKVLQKEQFEKEEALQKDQFKKKDVVTKKGVEDEAKKTVDILVASRNKLIQPLYFWGLSREDVDLALARKYSEIIFPGDDASPVAEQSSAPPVADDTTKEEVVCLRGKVIELEKALSRARDYINQTQQVHNKLEYEIRFHKSNFDKTFKELFELQCRYGKIKIERDEVLRKESDRFALFQNSLKNKQLADESDKLECHRSLLPLTLHFKAEVDSEWGLKEAYLELLTERGIVSDPARVKFLAQEGQRAMRILFFNIKKDDRKIQAQLETDLRHAYDELERCKGHNACLEREKAEDDEQDELVILFASNKELSARLQQCLLVAKNMTLSNSNQESDMLELQSRLNAVTIELSCKDAEILTANNEAELWKESLKKKKLETMAANQQVLDLLNNVTLHAMAMLHADVEKFQIERESILAASTEYVMKYDLQLARLSYIDNLMPRVMELLNAPSTVVDAAIPFPALLSSWPGESSNVVRPKREK